MDQRIIDLYDEYTHKPLDRRQFLDRLAKLTGSMAVALSLVPLLEASKAAAAIVPEDDARLRTETVSFPAAEGDLSGYLVLPAEASGPLPGVVVVHENRGLNPHIRDIARRVALAGYVALAPDFLSSLGGTPEDEDKARDMIGQLDQARTTENARQAVSWLRGREETTDRVGAMGFCWGGGVIGRLAVAEPDLDAGVVFYGPAPDPAQVSRIRAPLLLHYAGLDERINSGIPAFRQALDQAGVTYQLYMYEGANHAFNNDTSEARFDPQAAELAWQRTLAFLEETLKSA
ncbi:dienelactone hydrolase family protein [Telmatospirillum sp. J64-1]|uniref:dienelactone hydrolase family protein n=1 Tax=Telmatospirillum sp. J64-1 TaxID=2502183 RepID=UPI00115F4C78|nr:dienelactone hydrolase family protein [Telmatospirillum sp. J64-1]